MSPGWLLTVGWLEVEEVGILDRQDTEVLVPPLLGIVAAEVMQLAFSKPGRVLHAYQGVDLAIRSNREGAA